MERASRTPSWQAPPLDSGAGRLAGSVAFVTGAGRNIGRAIALRCGAEGARVAVNDVDRDATESVVAALQEQGITAFAAVGDMSSFADIDRVFGETEAALGTVNVLVNNAYIRSGATNWGPFLQVDAADWDLFVRGNMDMLFGCTSRMARALAADGLRGSVINISSHGADRAHRNHIAYDSVKGAMDSFTRAVAVDLAPWGIRVNGIRPGAIEVLDEPIHWTDDARGDLRTAQIPMGRPGTPEDIAGCVVFLASDESAYVTGQTFNADGGMLAQGRAAPMEALPVGTPATVGTFSRRLTPAADE